MSFHLLVFVFIPKRRTVRKRIVSFAYTAWTRLLPTMLELRRPFLTENEHKHETWKKFDLAEKMGCSAEPVKQIGDAKSSEDLSMAAAWERTVCQELGTHGRYRHAAVLIVVWDDHLDKDLNCGSEVGRARADFLLKHTNIR